MVTYAQLRDAKPDKLMDDYKAWSQAAKDLEDLQETFMKGVVARIEWGGWKGRASREALAYNDEQYQRLNDASVELGNIAVGLSSAHETFSAAHKKLQDAITDAEEVYGLTVEEDGYVHDGSQADVNHIVGRMDAALADATTADQETAKLLSKLAKAAKLLDDPGGIDDKKLQQDSRAAIDVEGGVEVDGSPLETPTTPQETSKWWAALTPVEREQVLEAYPSLVGGANGIPAVDRDEANRQLMQNKLDWLRNHKGDLTEHQQKVLQGLSAVEGRLGQAAASVDGPPYFVLNLDTEGDGRAAVAVGNPNTASHTSVYVPGSGANLGNYGTHLDRAAAVQAEAAGMTQPPGDVAVVGWLGYDAPEEGWTKAQSDAARKGAEELNSYLNGLRAVRENVVPTMGSEPPPTEQQEPGTTRLAVPDSSYQPSQPQHVTVTGHGYGSVVVGEAAKQGDLAADDIIATGSAGMNVDNAGQLDVGAGHVWAGSAEGDAHSNLGAGWYGHGEAPGTGQFGGHKFATDTENHDGYWAKDSETLKNQARIITGRYSEVSEVPNS